MTRLPLQHMGFLCNCYYQGSFFPVLLSAALLLIFDKFGTSFSF
jgi:hypothetical protein